MNTVSTATMGKNTKLCLDSLRYSLCFPSLSIFEVKLSQGEDSHSSKGDLGLASAI